MATFTAPFQGQIDVALSSFAREFRNPVLVSDLIAPRVPVLKQIDAFAQFGEESLEDPGNELRAPTAAAIELVQTLSKDRYFADDHALSRLVPLEEESSFEFGDVRQWATQMLTDRLLLKKEKRLRDVVTDASHYAASNKVTLAGTKQWTDKDNSTPIADVMAARKQVGLIGRPANLMVIGPDTFQVLKVHPKVTERFINVKAGAVTRQDLETVFEMRVIVAEAVEKTGAARSYLWPDTVWVGYAQETPSRDDVSFIKTFVWTTAPGTVQGFSVEINPVFPVSRKSESVDVHFYYDQKITAADAGYLIIDTNL